ncbi:MAG: hypothetical protein U0892_14620 [Pirellulales bacterium]
MSEAPSEDSSMEEVRNPYQSPTEFGQVPIYGTKDSRLSNAFWINVSIVSAILVLGAALVEPYTFGAFVVLEIPVIVRVVFVHRNFLRSSSSNFPAVGSYYWSWFLAGTILTAAGFAFFATCTVTFLAGGGPPMDGLVYTAIGLSSTVALMTFFGIYVLTFRLRF